MKVGVASLQEELYTVADRLNVNPSRMVRSAINDFLNKNRPEMLPAMSTYDNDHSEEPMVSAKLKNALPRRDMLFQHIATLTQYMYFANWQALIQFMTAHVKC